MKKLLFTLLFVLPLMANAQKNLDGFWGLNFYMTPEKVQEIIKARTGKMPEDGSGPTIMGYKNVEFAGHKAYFVQLMFNNDKLYGGDIIITPGKSELLETYNNIVAGIAAKYSKPTKGKGVYDNHTQPEMTYNPVQSAIYAIWTFPPGSKTNPKGKISASIEDNVIKISYRDGAIYDLLVTSAETYKQYDY